MVNDSAVSPISSHPSDHSDETRCRPLLPCAVITMSYAWPQDTDPSDGGVLNAINVLQMPVQETADRDYAAFMKKMRRAAILCRGGNGKGRVNS